MPTISVKPDNITSEISKMFDYEFSGQSSFTPHPMPNIPEHFGIGLIVGASGSGKSTMLKQFGDEEVVEWDSDKAVCSHFSSADEAKDKLSAVGFNSIPSWMRPHHVLSTGEAFRANLARRIKSGCVIDEFTSVVDRNVAKSCSRALSRYVEKNNLKNIVVASCHSDIIDWLQPDWVFNTDNGQLSTRGCERRSPPEISLEILPASYRAWEVFGQHHYLDNKLNKSSRCWIAVWDGVLVGFASAITFPSGTVKNAWRGHRTVILPDFQGFGIGTRLSDVIGEIFISEGCRYFSKTAHPRLGEYRNSSCKWRPTSKNGKARPDYKEDRKSKEDGHKMKHINRVCYSHEYIGSHKEGD